MSAGLRPAGPVVARGLPAALVRTTDIQAAKPAAGALQTFAECSCPVWEGEAPALVVPTREVRPARVAAATVRRVRWRMNEPASVRDERPRADHAHGITVMLGQRARNQSRLQPKMCSVPSRACPYGTSPCGSMASSPLQDRSQ